MGRFSLSFAFVLVLRFGLWGAGDGEGDRIDSEEWVGGLENEMGDCDELVDKLEV